MHGQNCICRSSGIQIGACKTLVESKTRKADLRKQACAQMAGLPIMILATDPKTALYLCGLSYSSILPRSCHQHYLSRDPGGVTPTCALGKGLLTSIQFQSFLAVVWEQSCSAQGLARRHSCPCSWRQICWFWSNMAIHTFRRRPTNLILTWSGSVAWLQTSSPAVLKQLCLMRYKARNTIWRQVPQLRLSCG